MWPWEHAIVGYLGYSVFCHLVYREAPTGLEAIAVVFAAVAPDVVDKPLAWEFGVFESGYALGHSIVFAIPLAIVVGGFARSVNRTRAGIAFAIGYLLHAPSDVLYHYAANGLVQWELMLWPVESVPPDRVTPGFVESFSHLFDGYLDQLLAGDLPTYVKVQLAVAVFTALLWLYDGAPVLRDLVVGAKRLLPTGANEEQRSVRNRR